MIAEGSIIGGRYRIEGKIGDGGMQAVYRATDLLIDRGVALKTPLPGQALKRFADSARIAARINHHSVAKTYDYFEDGNVPYLIEELVLGPNLEQAVPEGTWIDPHEAARIFLGIIKGIAASHQAGVVHRDLKPSNLLASGPLPFDVVKISDFGIATLADEVFEQARQSGDMTRSTSGTVKGALPYMAPEMMFRRPGQHPGKEADVWSFGALMFRLLTGEVPFGFGFEVPVRITNGDRTPWPGFMTANPQFAPLARELQEIVECCLIFKTEDRPSTADLIDKCASLCFSNAPRQVGVVTSINGSHGRIRSAAGSMIYFHADSVYNDRGRLAPNDRVAYSAFPGAPLPRAHPVSRIG